MARSLTLGSNPESLDLRSLPSVDRPAFYCTQRFHLMNRNSGKLPTVAAFAFGRPAGGATWRKEWLGYCRGLTEPGFMSEGLVTVSMSSPGHDMSVFMLAANNRRHGSYNFQHAGSIFLI